MVSLEELAERDGENQIRRLHAAHTLDDIKPRIWNLNGELSTLGDFVQDHSIDLLVLGLSGRSVLSKILLGSVAQQIFHYVSCPVLTVGPWSRGAMKQLQLKNVLFATDLSSQSTAALPYVLSAAKAWRASIDVLHVCSPHRPDSELRMETYRRRLQTLTIGELHLSIRYHVLPGEPADVVLDFAGRNNGDLMVLGLSHDRSLYAGPSISQAYEIVRRALCPVLSVPTLSACGLGQ
jgi:nucleotide-binding universal stress UspA family protein